MRLLATQSILVLLLAMGLVGGCANVPEPVPVPSNRVPLVCTHNVSDSIADLNWELTVNADPIEGGKPFTASLGGVVEIAMLQLNGAQLLLGGFQELNVVDFKATVHVRSGAVGEDVILEIEPVPYQCFSDRNECNPDNDFDGVPGRRGNTDCQPERFDNPCGRFLQLEFSSDCDPGGVCDELGWTGPDSQCDLNDFCITEDVRVPLEEKTATYTADAGGEVLFGWDDQKTGATEQEGGPNDGAWILPPAVYEVETGPSGLRLMAYGAGLLSFPVAMECTMGVPCGDCFDPGLAARAPDGRLIALPIESPP